MHWRTAKPHWPEFIKAVLDEAIAAEENNAIAQCVLYAMESGPGNGVPLNSDFFKPALAYLTARKDVRWVQGAWFAHKSLPFLDALTTEEAEFLLNGLLDVPKVEFQVERILSQIARKYRSLVWDCFGQRLKSCAEREREQHYEAFPFEFHGLEKELSKDAKLAVSTVRRWYGEDSSLFRFLGGRLLSTAFSKFDAGIAEALSELVTNGTSADADFVLAVMENYEGETATHEVLKCIVAKYPDDQSKLTSVGISFDNTGVVGGEFGYVDAIRRKKVAIEPWLTDPRPEVRAFAEKHIRDFDLRIAEEQRRAEGRKALRELEYDGGRDGEGDEEERNDKEGDAKDRDDGE